MTQQEQTNINKAIDLIMPEVIEIKKIALADNSTKDGYGVILSYLTKLNNKQTGQLILLALMKTGYPIDTIQSLNKILY